MSKRFRVICFIFAMAMGAGGIALVAYALGIEKKIYQEISYAPGFGSAVVQYWVSAGGAASGDGRPVVFSGNTASDIGGKTDTDGLKYDDLTMAGYVLYKFDISTAHEVKIDYRIYIEVKNKATKAADGTLEIYQSGSTGAAGTQLTNGFFAGALNFESVPEKETVYLRINAGAGTDTAPKLILISIDFSDNGFTQ